METHKLADDSGSTEREVVRFSLLVTNGPDAGLAFSPADDTAVIGTHECADLILKDPTVSRFHCEIAVRGSALVIRDLASRNGTLVDRTSIIEAHLHTGAVLTLGRTQLRFDVAADTLKLPLSTSSSFGILVGRSPVIRRVFALLEKASSTDATVLLEGDTGTGKEAAAESIHRASSRRDGPFVAIDCSAIPADLLESELFGHERGAFTGAIGVRAGAFEAAHGGTVFLDEIGELSPDLQPKLLRVLERKETKRLGTNTTSALDVRVIAATNRNLREEVNARRFRSDLYYRLAVISVRLPPLRERREDLPLLVDHLLETLGLADHAEASLLRQPKVQAELLRHDWPGNVRELRNYLERCIALREQLPFEEVSAPAPSTNMPLAAAREQCVRNFERAYVAELLREHGDNVTAAARTAGITRVHLHRLIYKYRLH
jgi:two-component system, NtrC family, response regulator GlrR